MFFRGANGCYNNVRECIFNHANDIRPVVTVMVG